MTVKSEEKPWSIRYSTGMIVLSAKTVVIQLYYPILHWKQYRKGFSLSTVFMFNRGVDFYSTGFQILGFGAGIQWDTKNLYD